MFRGGELQFPDGFLGVKEERGSMLTKVLKPRERDVIVIGTARGAVKAETGAKAGQNSYEIKQYLTRYSRRL